MVELVGHSALVTLVHAYQAGLVHDVKAVRVTNVMRKISVLSIVFIRYMQKYIL